MSPSSRLNRPIFRDRRRHAFEFMAAALLGDEQASDLTLHSRRDHDRTRFGQRLCPRGDVWHIPENLARRIHYNRPRVDRDARSECGLTRALILAVQLGQRPLDRERRADRTSSRAAMPVESTRSQNITVTCRRSPVASIEAENGGGATVAGVGLGPARRAATQVRCPTRRSPPAASYDGRTTRRRCP